MSSSFAQEDCSHQSPCARSRSFRPAGPYARLSVYLESSEISARSSSIHSTRTGNANRPADRARRCREEGASNVPGRARTTRAREQQRETRCVMQRRTWRGSSRPCATRLAPPLSRRIQRRTCVMLLVAVKSTLAPRLGGRAFLG